MLPAMPFRCKKGGSFFCCFEPNEQGNYPQSFHSSQGLSLNSPLLASVKISIAICPRQKKIN